MRGKGGGNRTVRPFALPTFVASMHTPPPSYDNIFPHKGTVGGGGGASLPPPLSSSAACVFPVVDMGASGGVGVKNDRGGGSTDFLYAGKPVSTLPPPVLDMPLSWKPDSNKDDILRHLVSLREEISSIRGRLINRSSSAAALVDASTQISSAPSPSATNTCGPTTTTFFADSGTVDWVKLLLWHQTQIEALSEALCRALAAPSRASEPAAVGEAQKNLPTTTKKTASLTQRAYYTEKFGRHTLTGRHDASVGSSRDITVGLVDLMTALYNLPATSCECCRERLPSTFGEELVAATLGTTSRDILEQYASLLVTQLNDGYAAVEISKDVHTTAIVLGSKSGEAAIRVLAPLPPSVLHQVLERTLFPSEIPAYRIAFAACEAHHRRHLLKWTSFSRPTPFVESSAVPFLSGFTTNCHCKQDDAEKLLSGVRFLWLPLHFLENELRRCEGFGLMAEACRCAVYAGLLVRLRQAVRVKTCVKDALGTPAQPLPAACTAEPLLIELRHVRTSYTFLTLSEKRQIVNAEKIDLSHLWQLQRRCDACS